MTDGTTTYERVIRYVGDTAWAIHPADLATILSIVQERRAGARPSKAEIRARIAYAREQRGALTDPPVAPPGVAVIPIDGTIVPKGGTFDDVSSAMSMEGLQTMFRAALASPDVGAIVLNVDSPGGSVDLVPEVAAEMFAARGTKPIVAVANTWAASAAYWLATAADELVVSPSGEVGSVGVYSAHQDRSGQLAAQGITTTLISAGEHKVESSPYAPLSTSARAEMQAKVDHYYRMFTEAVSAHRGVDLNRVLSDFGQGRMVTAEDAVARGMADRVDTLDATIERVAAGVDPAIVASATAAVNVGADLPHNVSLLRTPRSVDAMRELRELRADAPPWEVRRGGSVELRSAHTLVDDIAIMFGYAAVWNVEYRIDDAAGGYTEVVREGAFTKTLKDQQDPRLYANHEGLTIARRGNDTLWLNEDDVGLYFEAHGDRRRGDVNDLALAMERGDVNESSFAFAVAGRLGVRWNLTMDFRELLELRLFDVAIVNEGASPAATAGIRTAAPDEVRAVERDLEATLSMYRARVEVARRRLSR